MTRAELVQEVVDRGYDYVSTARIGTFIDRAYQWVCARHGWPFLDTETEGDAPLALTDLRRILSVKGASTKETLTGADSRVLERTFPSLEEEGTPEYFYLDGNTIRVYPLSTETLKVRYRKIPTTLGTNDTPLVPDEWQYILVDRAIVDCLRDDDEYAEARALLLDVKESVDVDMRSALLNRNHQNGEVLLRTGGFEDYL